MSDRNQGQGTGQDQGSSGGGIREAVVETARQYGGTVGSVASAAGEQLSGVMDQAGEYASYAGEYAQEAAYGVSRRVQRNPTATALICVGAGLLIGGLALTYMSSQQNSGPSSRQGRPSGRQPRQRGGRKSKGG